MCVIVMGRSRARSTWQATGSSMAMPGRCMGAHGYRQNLLRMWAHALGMSQPSHCSTHTGDRDAGSVPTLCHSTSFGYTPRWHQQCQQPQRSQNLPDLAFVAGHQRVCAGKSRGAQIHLHHSEIHHRELRYEAAGGGAGLTAHKVIGCRVERHFTPTGQFCPLQTLTEVQ